MASTPLQAAEQGQRLKVMGGCVRGGCLFGKIRQYPLRICTEQCDIILTIFRDTNTFATANMLKRKFYDWIMFSISHNQQMPTYLESCKLSKMFPDNVLAFRQNICNTISTHSNYSIITFFMSE